jgi:hypothetical protein
MKKQLRFGWVILALAFLTTCDGGVENYVVGTEAFMTGLSIKTVRIEDIPQQPIESLNYDDDDFNISGAPIATAALERSSDTVQARFTPTVSKGARVRWGIGTIEMRPFTYNDLRVPASFEDGEIVYFRVTSEDGEITNYYRWLAWVRSPVVELAEVYIGIYETHTETNDQGTTVTVVDVDQRQLAVLPTGSPKLETAIVANPGSISIMVSEANQAEIKVTPFSASSTIRYALVNDSAARPTFGTTNTFNLNDQTFLYVEVTAENKVDVAYYKFRVDVGRIATIKKLSLTGSINNPDAELQIVSRGTQNSNWGNVIPGSFQTADMPSAGFGVQFEPDDPKAKVSYALVANRNASAPASFDSPNKVVFNGTNILAVKVESDNGRATRYYKIGVELLAAGFKKHPKSDYYYYYNADTIVGNPPNTINWYTYAKLTNVNPNHANFLGDRGGQSKVKPLSVELDREGTFTYQWYEANSWYGGYGFDSNGKILYYMTGNPEAVPETGFVEDDYHKAFFDEKKNVSFHNGGNQFYRLEYPGRIIPGETNPTFTPKIEDKRPFIDGFTSETHYYWVVVTDTAGRKAVSKRAAIVTERDPAKKHHIVDLVEDLYELDGSGNKVYWNAKNQNAFTFQRETYKIPVQIPSTFNINDYTISMVQALFWLKDGTPWIQNWTQGDIGFEDANGATLIYYNLTNNNGTLGLVGGGKEPGGGSLTATPKYLIVKPAGEKPVSQLPPFESDGVTPQPNNDAQGWFCGFIELVEVRFEGPAR